MSQVRTIGKPVHKILRNPNVLGCKDYRVYSRTGPLENTLKKLEDPQNGRELYLIGTTHASNLLANRTRDLIEEVKPSSVLVQTNEAWWDTARFVNATSQKQMDEMNDEFTKAVDLKHETTARGLIFQMRLYAWLKAAELCMGFPQDFHPFTPGLEVKYAIEGAINNGADINFAG